MQQWCCMALCLCYSMVAAFAEARKSIMEAAALGAAPARQAHSARNGSTKA